MLVVGGGIYGAAIAWEATLRGLSVALVERDDFGSQTSANSLKIIHGGLRYLQHLDLKRVRRSATERRVLMRIAPHLVHPLASLIPTYQRDLRGKSAMSAAMTVYDLLTIDRNAGADPSKHVPRGRLLSRAACLDRFPWIPADGLTGGAVYYDAQVFNSERLVLAFVRSAADAGALVANYAEATTLLQSGSKVKGVSVQDRLTGQQLDVPAKTIVDASGPWNWFDRISQTGPPARQVAWAKAFNVIVRRTLGDLAVGVMSRSSARGVGESKRLFFLAPWRSYCMIGTSYSAESEAPDSTIVSRDEVVAFLEDLNAAVPALQISPDEVTFVHRGLLPMDAVSNSGKEVRLRTRPEIAEQSATGFAGLVIVRGVKYTTARKVAVETVDRLFPLLTKQPKPSRSDSVPLRGGQIDNLAALLQGKLEQYRGSIDGEQVRDLVMEYGTDLDDVVKASEKGQLSPGDILRLRIEYAVRHEMAVTLSDIVFRRTSLGSACHPGSDVLHQAARSMASALGWDSARTAQEVEAVNAHYPDWLSSPATV